MRVYCTSHLYKYMLVLCCVNGVKINSKVGQIISSTKNVVNKLINNFLQSSENKKLLFYNKRSIFIGLGFIYVRLNLVLTQIAKHFYGSSFS